MDKMFAACDKCGKNPAMYKCTRCDAVTCTECIEKTEYDDCDMYAHNKECGGHSNPIYYIP